MVHKFISNDNKGNVNVFEVGSTYTKLGKVADPVENGDVANKAYVDAHSSSGGVMICEIVESVDPSDPTIGISSLNHTAQELMNAKVAFLIHHNEEDGGNLVVPMAMFGELSDNGDTYYGFVFRDVLGWYNQTFVCDSVTDYPYVTHEIDPK